MHRQCRAIQEEVGNLAGKGRACGNLGNCYMSLGQYAKAIELLEQHRAIAEEVDDRGPAGAGEGVRQPRVLLYVAVTVWQGH